MSLPLVTGASPDVISYNAMMTSYERCSHWQKALDLFISMPVPKLDICSKGKWGSNIFVKVGDITFPHFFGGFCWSWIRKEWHKHFRLAQIHIASKWWLDNWLMSHYLKLITGLMSWDELSDVMNSMISCLKIEHDCHGSLIVSENSLQKSLW